MLDHDRKRFATILTGIADYYGKELSAGVLGLYWQGLYQYDLQAVEKALWEHTQNPDSGQFMPKIADVTRILQGGTADQASVAWSKVDRAVRIVGTYRDVIFDDAFIHRVIADMGGWIPLGRRTENEWQFVQREFENRYRGYKMRGDVPDYPPSLTGIGNTHNSSEGFPLQGPVLVGDAALARLVYAYGNRTQAVGIEEAPLISDMTKLVWSAK